MEYDVVIGLEVHVQVKTRTKLFSGCPYTYGAEPNTLTDPVVLGLPGALPVINQEAIRQGIKTGLMFECRIADICKWDRKHYFYPDCPKNYQISQYDQPLCRGGYVEIEKPGNARNIMGEHRKVALNRIHLEEDVGKLTHSECDSLVDFNRAGVPLLEIVSEPDIFSSEEAFAYLHSLQMHLIYAGISDGDMEKGHIRCDANISLRPKGSSTLGTRVELKNLNSISGVKNGIEYEVARQKRILDSGGYIEQETRRWDAEQHISTGMRTKEMADDYRYFPDPDIMPVTVDEKLLSILREELPELPFRKQERYQLDYDLPYTLTSVLCPNAELSAFYERAIQHHQAPRIIANFIANDLLRELGESNGQITLQTMPLKPEHLAKLAQFIEEGRISKQVAQNLFMEVFRHGKSLDELICAQQWEQSFTKDELNALCRRIMTANPKPVEEYRRGKTGAINALKGPVMKETKGQANPQLIDQVLKELLSE
ncbi:MAG: Asp-tRNA(Asn)/Glu-tRNA(Gln) amidotransferase subunit GatB [Puniceicoccales bacterium]|jgi:aspartyl-tRNA(Asn)/glutamyl-tRNA(Gln) amidotransferase subunit B|nr:Asp-tRNA(Asn)/Glu-tRNA(Gln) amidotransferase subunit GatB [Puniceicoccales bacterium]